MNKKVFGFNWLFRSSNGLLVGLKFRPAIKIVSSKNVLFFEQTIVIEEIEPVPGEKIKLIKETDKSLDFIKKNKLYHISELTNSNAK